MDEKVVYMIDAEQRRYEVAKLVLPMFLKNAIGGNSNRRLVTGVLQDAVNDAVEVADLLTERLAEGGTR